jgi:hypothetical protein
MAEKRKRLTSTSGIQLRAADSWQFTNKHVYIHFSFAFKWRHKLTENH